MDYKSPPGVFDIIPKDSKESWRSSYIWQEVESVIRETAQAYGYSEIRTPLFEKTELFQRGVGATSDIVSKEMYTFEDKGGRLLSLRPEGTASVMRAFIEHRLANEASVHKLFYIGPMFRYERSQAGRYRQHHQFGAEAIGSAFPEQDVELIDLIYTVYQKLGLRNIQVSLNSLGSPESRVKYRIALQDYLKARFDELSKDSQNRFEANPLRILDSKDPKDREILVNAPSLLKFLDGESLDHFEKVKQLLDLLKIPYVVNEKLVRGLDYYNKTVFEMTSSELGAQNSIGGGGRYDGLMKMLGGPDLPTIGFGCGIERVIQTMLKQQVFKKAPPAPRLFLIALGEKAFKTCFSLLHLLRSQGISTYMDFSGKKLGKQMSVANEMNAKFVLVIGESEIETNQIELKTMATGEVIKLPLQNLSKVLKADMISADFLKIWPDLARPFEEPFEAQVFLNQLNTSIDYAKKAADDLADVANELKRVFET